MLGFVLSMMDIRILLPEREKKIVKILHLIFGGTR
jgi:hypothetical protein